jgi:HK97 family phage prohead protease
MIVEHASVGPNDLDLKFVSGANAGDTGTFTGYGSVFNNLDSYNDKILPGAFAQTLKDAKKSGIYPAMLLQHGSFLGGDDDMPVGIWTLMEEDDKGLRVTGKLADTQRGQDTYKLMTMTPRPAISGLSIGFMVKEYAAGTKPGEPRRTIKAIDLMECSIVTFPANLKAQIDSVRAENRALLERAQTGSAQDQASFKRHLERVLTRDACLSEKEAKALISGGFRAIAAAASRDVGAELTDLLATIRAANAA